MIPVIFWGKCLKLDGPYTGEWRCQTLTTCAKVHNKIMSWILYTPYITAADEK